jgi:hypothetical protein
MSFAECLGILLLGVMWVEALLVAGSAWKDLRDLPPHDLRNRIVSMAFIVGELAVCVICTAIALQKPVFGPLSRAGALSCLTFFLGVTPVAVWLRDRCRARR